MRSFAITRLLLQAPFYTTFVWSSCSDRCRRSAAQTPRGSTARAPHLRSANAIALVPCGANKPIDCCCRKTESSCDLFSNLRIETDDRFEGSAVRSEERRVGKE